MAMNVIDEENYIIIMSSICVFMFLFALPAETAKSAVENEVLQLQDLVLVVSSGYGFPSLG
jgi:hypothetical protein